MKYRQWKKNYKKKMDEKPKISTYHDMRKHGNNA